MSASLSCFAARRLHLASLILSFASLTTFAQTPSDAASQTALTNRWVGTWAASPVGVPNAAGTIVANEVLYETVHVSRGGATVRVTFTNEFGEDTLLINGAQIALRGPDGQPTSGSAHILRFAGQPATQIPPGAVMVSDPVAMPLPASSDLSINLLLPAQTQQVVTAHTLGLQTNYEAPGDSVAGTAPGNAKPFQQFHFLKNIEVLAPAPTAAAAAIVTFGDSITDGYRSTPDANRRWPDVLAARLQSDPRLHDAGILNEGISGNRVLHDGAGPSALARFDRDVLSQNGVRYVIVLESINDIGHSAQPRNADDPITADMLTAGFTQLIERAHAHGILVYGATLTPFLGAGYASPTGETMRQTVNSWIRTAGHFDGVIDFDKLTRDPGNPTSLLPAFDSGDHLHPNDAGYKAMGEGIDLSLFTR